MAALLTPRVIGCNRDPVPPAKMIPRMPRSLPAAPVSESGRFRLAYEFITKVSR